MVKARLTALSFAGILLVFDQISKYWAAHVRPDIQVIPGLFNLIYVENTGAAFGILRDQQLLLVTIKIIAIGVLLCLIFYERDDRKGILYALSMILSGTCGNLIDRLRLGYVVDFLDVYVSQYHWPTFNIADSSITVGVIILIFTLFFEEFHVTSTEAQQK